MALLALISGVTGGMLAVAAGIYFFYVILSDARFMLGDLWFMFVLVVAMAMGILSVSAVAIRNRRPDMARTVIRLSIFGMVFTAIWGDIFTLGIFLVPAAILLIPEAVLMSRPLARS